MVKVVNKLDMMIEVLIKEVLKLMLWVNYDWSRLFNWCIWVK